MLAGAGAYLGTCVESARAEMTSRLAEGQAQIEKKKSDREEKFVAYQEAQKQK